MIMTPEEFEKQYCSICGSQQCSGIADKEFREGCPHYSKEYFAIKDMIETTWPQWKIDLYNTQIATSAHAIKLRKRSKAMTWIFEKFLGCSVIYAICPNCGFYYAAGITTKEYDGINQKRYCPECGKHLYSNHISTNVIWNERDIEALINLNQKDL